MFLFFTHICLMILLQCLHFHVKKGFESGVKIEGFNLKGFTISHLYLKQMPLIQYILVSLGFLYFMDYNDSLNFSYCKKGLAHFQQQGKNLVVYF